MEPPVFLSIRGGALTVDPEIAEAIILFDLKLTDINITTYSALSVVRSDEFEQFMLTCYRSFARGQAGIFSEQFK